MDFINRVSMLLKLELWRDVVGYEGLYKVSNFGRVKSLNYLRTGKERILKPKKKKNGYLQVSLSKNGNVKYYHIHRLVAQAFLYDYSDNLQVNHLNGYKTDNTITNLEMVTASENIIHAFETGLNPSRKPVRIKNNEEELIFESTTAAAKYIGCHHTAISKCASGKRKTIYGYKVEFINTEDELDDSLEMLDSKVS